MTENNHLAGSKSRDFELGGISTNFRNMKLRTKLAGVFLLVALIPLVILFVVDIGTLRQHLTNTANYNLRAAAQNTADNLDKYIDQNLKFVRVMALSHVWVSYLQSLSSQQLDTDSEKAALSELTAISRYDSLYITSVTLFDSEGKNVADTDTGSVKKNASGRLDFQEPKRTSLSYVSPVEISEKPGQYSIYFSAPVLDENLTVIGVLRICYNADILQQLIAEFNGLAGEQSYAALFDEYHINLANGEATDRLLFRPTAPLAQTTLQDLQNARRLPAGESATESSNNTLLDTSLKNYAEQPISTTAFHSDDSENDAVAIIRMKNQPWLVVFSSPETILLSPVINSTNRAAIIAVLITLAVVLAAFGFAQTLSRPILNLTNVAQRFAAGDMEAQASVQSNDEIGRLAQSFNLMTAQLKNLLNTLEQRVENRTSELQKRTNELEIVSKQQERRATEFQAIAQVSRAITSVQTIEELLPGIARGISDQFNFYHIGIFMIDEDRQYAKLSASNSEGGQKMLARGHQLKIGEVGLVGNVAKSGKPRIALETDADAVFFNNPDLPDTRSEVALPLAISNEVIGVLDIQSDQVAAFTDENMELLTIMADQISIAIRNAQLFKETRKALAEAEATYRQYVQREWRNTVEERQGLGYRYSGSGMKPFGEAAGSLKENQTAQVEIPVKLRGQVIGRLNVQSNREKPLGQDEIDIAQAVADRVALAIENARLLESSQSQATRERTIGEITSKIGASVNLSNVLQTAVEELGRVLPGSEVVIQIQNTDDKK